MKDVDNNEINLGDRIAYCVSHNSKIQTGMVRKITAKSVVVNGTYRKSDQISLIETLVDRYANGIEWSAIYSSDCLKRVELKQGYVL